MKLKYPIEYVVWDDHYSIDAWKDISEHDNNSMQVTSVGFLIKEDDKAITLCLNLGEDDEVSAAMIIIKAQIVQRKRIKNAVSKRKVKESGKLQHPRVDGDREKPKAERGHRAGDLPPWEEEKT